MNKRSLGTTGIEVTTVGMGVLTVGRTQLNLSLEKGAAVVRHAMERGITFFDTAECYETYPYIRRALDELAPAFSQNILPRPVIASKSLVEDYDGMRTAIEDCRIALNRDQIDIFLLHEVRQEPDFQRRTGAWACLHNAKIKGLVKAIGISTHHVDVAAAATKTFDMDIIFPLINYQGLGIRNGDGPGTKEDMAAVISSAYFRGIGVFAMKAFGGGNLVQGYTAALDYVLGLKGIDSVMIGMGSKQDVDEAIAYADGKLPPDFRPDASGKRMFVDRGDCEGCGSCVSRCTSKAIRLDHEGIAVIDHQNCVLCGYCAPVCPTRALLLL